MSIPAATPMKNNQISQTYVSTSQAAKILGLSVGTVQRMVQNGVFKAFVTHGGHRRILSESLQDYCKGQGFLPHPAQAPAELLCILHDSAHLSQALSTLAQWAHVTVMTHPLDLMEIAQDVRVFFIDARIPWLHTSTVHLQNARMQHAHIVLYNSASLPTNSPLNQAEHLSMFEGDISTDLVYGYWLCTQHAQETQARHH
jgi:excisionase family DNA binding protein